MDYILKVVLAYLLGSVVGSLVVGRLRGGVDIRKLGSGNAGGTNALRTQGPWFAFWVMVIDVGKGWVAAGWLPGLESPLAPFPSDTPAIPPTLPGACAFASIFGHVFPVWHGFRGGKGVATFVGALAGLGLQLLVPVFATWLILVVVSGYVGLASMTAATALPVFLVLRDGLQDKPMLLFAVASAVLIIFTHRGNIARMRAGTESRAKRLWLLGRGSS
jgi:acyl phosphate:glycerol-3-phosphate acyltransferase